LRKDNVSLTELFSTVNPEALPLPARNPVVWAKDMDTTIPLPDEERLGRDKTLSHCGDIAKAEAFEVVDFPRGLQTGIERTVDDESGTLPAFRMLDSMGYWVIAIAVMMMRKPSKAYSGPGYANAISTWQRCFQPMLSLA
jgi:hypothetical protein